MQRIVEKDTRLPGVTLSGENYRCVDSKERAHDSAQVTSTRQHLFLFSFVPFDFDFEFDFHFIMCEDKVHIVVVFCFLFYLLNSLWFYLLSVFAVF